MKLRNLPRLYVARVRSHPASEALALIGIATGVALVFAVQVANGSIFGSVHQATGGVVGDAQLELAARGPAGFHERLAERVRDVQGVRQAAAILEVRARVRGPAATEPVNLVGVDPALAGLGGSFLREFASPNFVFLRGVALPESMGDRVGVGAAGRVTIDVGGRRVRAPVATLLSRTEVGALADNPLVPGPLEYVQRVASMPDRVTRVLIAAEEGQEEAVTRRLRELVGGRIDVRPSDSEVRLLEDAGTANSQSTGLYAGVSALVGFLFAFNAMLLTAPERRRFIAGLRLNGYSDGAVLKILLFDGVVLGVAASSLGLLLGDLLSRSFFNPDPGYLSFAFAVGDHRVVTTGAVALAFGAGVVGAIVANARPFADLLSSRPVDTLLRGSDGVATGARVGPRALGAAAVALLAVATAVAVLVPKAAVVGVVVLVGAMLLGVAAILPPGLRLLGHVAASTRFPMFVVSVGELRSSTLRATALACTAALAVFGAIAIGGSRHDLLRGLYEVDDGFASTADVWVTAGGDENALTTGQFTPRASQLGALRTAPEVASVRAYRGGFLDMGGRRVWVIAREVAAPAWIPESQMIEGDVATATARLRERDWVAISEGIADRARVGVGDLVTLPTPAGPTRLRVAAVVGNFGWAPGAILMNGRTFGDRWETRSVAGLEVDLAPGTSPEEGRRAVAEALGPGSPLVVETAAHRAALFKRLAREGLDRLNQISALVLVAAILALAAAMTGVVWQRRSRLAGMKLAGFHERQVWRSLIVETSIVIGTGCVVGAVYGLYGQALLDRALQVVMGFPVQFSPAIPLAVLIIVGVAVIATAVTGVPGYLAAKVPPVYGFREE